MAKLVTHTVSNGVRIDKGKIQKYIALDKNSKARTLAVTLENYKGFDCLARWSLPTRSGDMVTLFVNLA